MAIFAVRYLDGINGAAVLVTLHRVLEASVDCLIPGKRDGAGLSAEAVANSPPVLQQC